MPKPRHARQIRQIGTVRLTDLPPEIQTDVAVCLERRIDRILNVPGTRPDEKTVWAEDILELLVPANPLLPLLLVSTALLVKTERALDDDRLAEYRAVWETGEVRFPPVVVDSEDEILLCEGGHRSFSAYQAGVKEIQAVDVAAIDLNIIKPLLPPPSHYRMLLSQEAERAYTELDRGAKRQVDTLLARLEAWPEVSGAIPLWGTGHGQFRMKTRDWRVIFHVDEASHELFIDKIAHRKEAYGEYH